VRPLEGHSIIGRKGVGENKNLRTHVGKLANRITLLQGAHSTREKCFKSYLSRRETGGCGTGVPCLNYESQYWLDWHWLPPGEKVNFSKKKGKGKKRRKEPN